MRISNDLSQFIKSLLVKLPYVRTLYAENVHFKKMIEVPNEVKGIHELFKNFTMTEERLFEFNLALVSKYRDIDGCVVECGTWRGGMIAGIANLFSKYNVNKDYYLFDSFEGLPDADVVDGHQAQAFASNKDAKKSI